MCRKRRFWVKEIDNLVLHGWHGAVLHGRRFEHREERMHIARRWMIVWIRAIYPEVYYMYLYVFVQSWL
jgi:hypothetical protein